MSRALIFFGLVAFAFNAQAQNVLIKNATVHTAGAQGTLKNTDVLANPAAPQPAGNSAAPIVAAPVTTMPVQGAVIVPVPPENLNPMQLLQPPEK